MLADTLALIWPRRPSKRPSYRIYPPFSPSSPPKEYPLIPPFLLSNIIPVAIAIPPLLFNSQNRNSPTPEMRSLGGPKMVLFLVSFLNQFWPQNGPRNGPKTGQKNNNFGVHFWIPFFKALELLGCLFGAFLGFLRLFWDASGPQKP